MTVQTYTEKQDDTKEYTKVDSLKKEPPRPQIHTYRQLRKTGNRRDCLLQGRAHQLFVQFQMLNPKNTYKEYYMS